MGSSRGGAVAGAGSAAAVSRRGPVPVWGEFLRIGEGRQVGVAVVAGGENILNNGYTDKYCEVLFFYFLYLNFIFMFYYNLVNIKYFS